MWSHSATLAGLVLVAACCCRLGVHAASLASAPDNDQDGYHLSNAKEEVAQAREMRKAILPLMVGILLKVSSIVPMKLMIMTFFAIMALITSKIALLLTTVVGIFHYKSNHPQQRFSTSGLTGSGYNSPSQSFAASLAATGDGTTGFDAAQPLAFVNMAAASSSIPPAPLPQTRRRFRVIHKA